MSCVFCSIIAGNVSAAIVLNTEHALGFLDAAPVFPGHVLVVPRAHVETLTDLPTADLGPFFAEVQRVAAALPNALGCDGTWVSMNNKVSQSVPHLHVHVVPRVRKDGLRGFYWPRQKYPDAAAAADMAKKIATALAE